MSNTKSSGQTPSAGATRPEKTMSSRLMNLKFMQRAAASTSTSTPTKPPPASNYTTVGTNSAKRRKTTDSPATPGSQTPPAPASAPRSTEPGNAYAEDYLGGRGETPWTLQFPSNSANGTSVDGRRTSIDNDEVSEEEDIPIGRRTYGTFESRRKTDSGDNDNDEDEDGESTTSADEDGERGEDEDEEPKSDRKPQRSKKHKTTSSNHDREDGKLWKLSSISSSGAGRGRGGGTHGGSTPKRDYGKAFASFGKRKDKEGNKRKRDRSKDV